MVRKTEYNTLAYLSSLASIIFDINPISLAKLFDAKDFVFLCFVEESRSKFYLLNISYINILLPVSCHYLRKQFKYNLINQTWPHLTTNLTYRTVKSLEKSCMFILFLHVEMAILSLLWSFFLIPVFTKISDVVTFWYSWCEMIYHSFYLDLFLPAFPLANLPFACLTQRLRSHVCWNSTFFLILKNLFLYLKESMRERESMQGQREGQS